MRNTITRTVARAEATHGGRLIAPEDASFAVLRLDVDVDVPPRWVSTTEAHATDWANRPLFTWRVARITD